MVCPSIMVWLRCRRVLTVGGRGSTIALCWRRGSTSPSPTFSNTRSVHVVPARTAAPAPTFRTPSAVCSTTSPMQLVRRGPVACLSGRVVHATRSRRIWPHLALQSTPLPLRLGGGGQTPHPGQSTASSKRHSTAERGGEADCRGSGRCACQAATRMERHGCTLLEVSGGLRRLHYDQPP